jgi:hypothetical protein
MIIQTGEKRQDESCCSEVLAVCSRAMARQNRCARERTKKPTNRNVVGQVLRPGRGRDSNDRNDHKTAGTGSREMY